MPEFSHEEFKLLFNADWPTNGLADDISRIDRGALCNEYEALRRCAPRRWSRRKGYFVEKHDGRLSTSGGSNRFEEHLAIALWRKGIFWPRPSGGGFRLLDYQVPLQARRFDKGIGKIDLLGVTDRGRLTVIELKVKPKRGKERGESPVAAFMQALRYAAIVEANRARIAKEAEERFGSKIEEEPPIVQILAPKAWWLGWLQLAGSTRKAAGCWETKFAKLTSDMKENLGVVVECVALDDLKTTDIDYGAHGNRPQVDRDLALYPVQIGHAQAIGSAMVPYRSEA